jgi:DHA2 family multidrug resistance protein
VGSLINPGPIRWQWQQASALAYFDVFWVSAAVAVVLVFLVLLIRPSVAAKGTHVGAE